MIHAFVLLYAAKRYLSPAPITHTHTSNNRRADRYLNGSTQGDAPSTTARQDFVKIAFKDTKAEEATPNSVPSNEKFTSPSVPSCTIHNPTENQSQVRQGHTDTRAHHKPQHNNSQCGAREPGCRLLQDEICEYDVEHDCERSCDVVEGHLHVLQANVVERDHAHKQDGQHKGLACDGQGVIISWKLIPKGQFVGGAAAGNSTPRTVSGEITVASQDSKQHAVFQRRAVSAQPRGRNELKNTIQMRSMARTIVLQWRPEANKWRR